MSVDGYFQVGDEIELFGDYWGAANQGRRLTIKSLMTNNQSGYEVGRAVADNGTRVDPPESKRKWTAVVVNRATETKYDELGSDISAKVAKLKDELYTAVIQDWDKVGSDRVLNVAKALREAMRIPLPTRPGFYLDMSGVSAPGVYELDEDEGWMQGTRRVSEEELYHDTGGKLARMVVAKEVNDWYVSQNAVGSGYVAESREEFENAYKKPAKSIFPADGWDVPGEKF